MFQTILTVLVFLEYFASGTVNPVQVTFNAFLLWLLGLMG
jgi:hypothetical protein